MTTLTFQNTTLSVINQNNQVWLTAQDVGKGLGYRNPTSDIKRIYERNIDEFTPNMTALIDIQTAGGMQKVRVFSLRGTHLIAIFSHTKVAKDFRKWVLDILDREAQQPKQLALPVPENKITLELTETELKHLAWLWKMSELMRGQLYALYEPLNQLGSRHAAGVYGKSREYKSPIEACRKILVRATQHIQTDKWDSNGWNNVIHELRDGEPRTLY